MKKTIIVCLVEFCLLMTGCGKVPGNTENVKITIDESEKYSREEIQSAMDVVLRYFWSFEGCTLTDLWYDDELSSQYAKDYVTSGAGMTGVKEENVIVLFSNFDTSKIAGRAGFTGDITYTDWSWTLVRTDNNSEWKVSGYGVW